MGGEGKTVLALSVLKPQDKVRVTDALPLSINFIMDSHTQPLSTMQEPFSHQVFSSNSDRSHQFQVAPFDMLPDDPLLSIFDFYVREDDDSKEEIETWHSLVHVCQRWRRLVFESPRRLDLRLVFTPQTPMRLLDVWPALPLCIHGWTYSELSTQSRAAFKNDVIAALKNSDRIRQLIIIPLPNSYGCQLQDFLAVMQVPFPQLTELNLKPLYEDELQVVPDSFLGGFAPRLRTLKLTGISFPGLPKLLLSATHLVNLHLHKIPRDGYVSSKDMVICLSLLTSLNKLTLKFHWESFRQYRPDPSQHLSPPTRLALPALTRFEFEGISKYLDDLVANLDAPQLRCMAICFSQENDFRSPQLARLINRVPRLEAPEAAHVDLTFFWVTFYYPGKLSSVSSEELEVELKIKDGTMSRTSRLSVSDLARACTSSLPFLSSVEKLFVNQYQDSMSMIPQGDDIVNEPWLALLRPFTAVKTLYLSGKCILRVANALQELDGDSVAEMLPALESIFLSDDPAPPGATSEILQQFASARQQLTGHLITVSPGEWHLWCRWPRED